VGERRQHRHQEHRHGEQERAQHARQQHSPPALAQPCVTFIGPGDGRWPVLRNLLPAGGTAGNSTGDAHLAALAIEHGCQVASADNDFRRFAGVSSVNPVDGD
jgi:predicted nucleic acid-binding protein